MTTTVPAPTRRSGRASLRAVNLDVLTTLTDPADKVREGSKCVDAWEAERKTSGRQRDTALAALKYQHKWKSVTIYRDANIERGKFNRALKAAKGLDIDQKFLDDPAHALRTAKRLADVPDELRADASAARKIRDQAIIDLFKAGVANTDIQALTVTKVKPEGVSSARIAQMRGEAEEAGLL